MNSLYHLGVGAGLRRPHFNEVLKHISNQRPLEMDWFEIISENFMNFGGRPEFVLEQVLKTKPVICHGLGLSIGSQTEFDDQYLKNLNKLLLKTSALWFSDHLCISQGPKHHYHDLIPVLRTKESLLKIVDKIKRVQDIFQKPFAIENISFYFESGHNQIPEIDFINQILDRTGCYLLLDINNIYVNSLNFKFCPIQYLESVSHDSVIQIHLAGHFNRGDLVIDTHGAKVSEQVWQLYESFLILAKRPISTLIEWDHDLPSFEDLEHEVRLAKEILDRVFPPEKLNPILDQSKENHNINPNLQKQRTQKEHSNETFRL